MQTAIYKQHHQEAFSAATAMNEADLRRVSNLLDRLLQTGASFAEANIELQRLFLPTVADDQELASGSYQPAR